MLLLAPYSAAQGNSRTLLFTSSKKHVLVPQGTTVTLKSIAAKVRGPADMTVVPPDHYLEAMVEQKIDGSRSKVGDIVHFSLAYPVVFEVNGTMVRIPAHASITGHVLVVAAGDGHHRSAVLAVVTDWIQWGSNFAALPGVVASAGPSEEAQLQALRFQR